MRGFGGGVILSAAAAWVGGGGGGVKLFSLCSALQFSRSFIVSCRVQRCGSLLGAKRKKIEALARLELSIEVSGNKQDDC